MFLVMAWVTTRGWFELPDSLGASNDGAVLYVQPLTQANTQPSPVATTTFNGVGSSIPALNITTSGFPCADDRFEGCDAANGLDDICGVLRGYTVGDALPILGSNNVIGDLIVYQGSSCGGHSGGPLSAPDNGVSGFGILVSGPTVDCTLAGGSSGSTYTQIVDKVQRYGVYVDALATAVTDAAGAAEKKQPRKPAAAPKPQPHKHTV